MKALQAKKHVLCEKPVSVTSSDYQDMLRIAKEVDRYIMDGTMFVHNNRTQLMMDYVNQEHIFGKVTRINAEFTFRGDDNFFASDIRTNKEGDPHGCIGDLGWYCVRLAQLVFPKATKAKRVQTTNWKLNDGGVPIDTTCLVFFQDEAVGYEKCQSSNESILSFHCSFLHPLHQRVKICGTKQSLEMNDFVIPKEGINTWVVHEQNLTLNDMYTVESNELMECPSGPVQEVLMWRNFSNFCKTVELNGWNDSEVMRISSVSVQNQRIVDALMESMSLEGKSVYL